MDLDGFRPLSTSHGRIGNLGHRLFVGTHQGPELLDGSWVIYHVSGGLSVLLEADRDGLDCPGYLPFGFGRGLGFDLPAGSKAIATACFWGLPSFTSLLIFWDTTFWDDPLCNGIEASTRL